MSSHKVFTREISFFCTKFQKFGSMTMTVPMGCCACPIRPPVTTYPTHKIRTPQTVDQRKMTPKPSISHTGTGTRVTYLHASDQSKRESHHKPNNTTTQPTCRKRMLVRVGCTGASTSSSKSTVPVTCHHKL